MEHLQTHKKYVFLVLKIASIASIIHFVHTVLYHTKLAPTFSVFLYATITNIMKTKFVKSAQQSALLVQAILTVLHA